MVSSGGRGTLPLAPRGGASMPLIRMRVTLQHMYVFPTCSTDVTRLPYFSCNCRTNNSTRTTIACMSATVTAPTLNGTTDAERHWDGHMAGRVTIYNPRKEKVSMFPLSTRNSEVSAIELLCLGICRSGGCHPQLRAVAKRRTQRKESESHVRGRAWPQTRFRKV